MCFPDKDGAHSSVSGTLAAALEKTGARRNRASVATPTAARRGPARDRRRRRAGPLNAVQFCPARNTLHRFGSFARGVSLPGSAKEVLVTVWRRVQ